MLMKLREGVESDLPDLMRLAHEMHQSTEFRGFRISANKIIDLAADLMQDDEALLLVATDEGRVQGFFGAEVVEFRFSNELLAIDVAMFSSKYSSKRLPFRKICETYLQWAKKREASRAIISQSTGVDVERFSRLLERLGFQKLGTTYGVDF